MRKFFSFIIALFVATSLHAETIYGDCGANMSWEFNTGSGALFLIGEGPMDDYSDTPAPWAEYKSRITSIQYDSRSKFTTIGSHAFKDCTALKSVDLPNTVKEIHTSAFSRCISLTEIQLPANLRTIDTEAFSHNYVLASVTLPKGLGSIYTKAFWNCSALTSVTIPYSVVHIESDAFAKCEKLQTINVASSNEGYCSLNGSLVSKHMEILYTVPGGTEGLYTIPSTITNIDEYAFAYCTKLKKIIFPASVERIYESAFEGCMMQSMELNEGVISIGVAAFAYCSEMTSLTLPSTLQEIKNDAFAKCNKLTSITCKATTPPTCKEYTFSYFDCSACKLYVPENAIDAYKKATGWKDFGDNIVAIGEGIEEVKANPELNGRKVIYNGQVYILQEGKSYTLTGTEVR